MQNLINIKWKFKNQFKIINIYIVQATIIEKEAKITSMGFDGVMSPYPTVVIVVTDQYKA
jgi:hypothetical protein